MKEKLRKKEEDEALFRERFAQLSRTAAQKPASEPLLVDFLGFEKHMIRPPENFSLRSRSSNRSKHVLEMARYLFGRYRVPKIMDQAWDLYAKPSKNDRSLLPRRGEVPNGPVVAAKNPNLTRINFRHWYVCLATGGSLYKEHTKNFLTKKETHIFLSVAHEIDACQAVIYSVARAAGLSDGHSLRLARSKLSHKEFTPFWFDCVRFFALQGNLPSSLPQVNDLVDFVQAKHAEDRNFRLLGSSQSLPAVLRRMEEWHRALARTKDLLGIEWPGVDLPDFTFEQNDPEKKNSKIYWAVTQITSGKKLAEEGSSMRHCVLGYKTRCVSGACSIWSLTRWEEFGSPVRRLTIELSSSGQIVQKRGLANRMPRPDEENVVSKWALARGLSNSRGW